jgi:membrane protein DedA with SNARE-associated domain
LEAITAWFVTHTDHAPFFIFGLLLLTGFSIPISEDILVIVSGVLAGTVLPEKKIALFLAAFFGSYCSDIAAFFVGRLLKNGLSRFFLTFERNLSVERFFRKYGGIALLIGRLIPFGIRNSIFMAAGAGRMHFGKFMLIDGIGCAFFSSSLFLLAARCGENYHSLHQLVVSIGYIIFGLFFVSICSWFIWSRFVKEESTESHQS